MVQSSVLEVVTLFPVLQIDADYQRAFEVGLQVYADEPLERESLEWCLTFVDTEFCCGQTGGNPLTWDIGKIQGWLTGVARTWPAWAHQGAVYLAHLVAQELVPLHARRQTLSASFLHASTPARQTLDTRQREKEEVA